MCPKNSAFSRAFTNSRRARFCFSKTARSRRKNTGISIIQGVSEIKSEAEYIEALREKIREAVRVRLISEVPLGAFLSGGVDSSSIVGMMAQISAAPVKTFSIGFNEDSFNELKFARRAAKHFNTEHHEFIVTPDLVETVDDLVWHFDEPFADSSALPTYMVSKMARDFVTVVLSGDGGDELFCRLYALRYRPQTQRFRETAARHPAKFAETFERSVAARREGQKFSLQHFARCG
jgi:asparagine synthetase B (glutamine-hydrolysing)